MTDPIRHLRRRIALTGIAGAIALLICTVWALRSGAPLAGPLSTTDLQPRPETADATGEEPTTAIDPLLFAVRLWNPPQPPKVETPQPTIVDREVRINLQLIAIVQEHAEDGNVGGDAGGDVGGRRAVLYDPQTDRLYIVGHGEKVLRHTITAVTDEYVELTATGRPAEARHRIDLARAGRPRP